MKNFFLSGITQGIRWYQFFLSPDHGVFQSHFGYARCRFYPTCSDYILGAIRQYGLLRGSVISLKRILRCNQFFEGGYDPLPRAAKDAARNTRQPSSPTVL